MNLKYIFARPACRERATEEPTKVRLQTMNDHLAARVKHVGRMAAPALFLVAALSGCAHAPPKADTAAYQEYKAQNDPIEPTNRFFYAVNDRIDRYAFKPVAQVYVAITTQGIRNHVGYFIGNIGEPARMVNFMFEGKSRDAGTSLVRFVLNSTIGIGGIFDPAAALGYKELDTDFGQFDPPALEALPQGGDHRGGIDVIRQNLRQATRSHRCHAGENHGFGQAQHRLIGLAERRRGRDGHRLN